eukprot:1031416-Pyramimonas_sp.AAC.1
MQFRGEGHPIPFQVMGVRWATCWRRAPASRSWTSGCVSRTGRCCEPSTSASPPTAAWASSSATA